jgi:hypothetical protein
MSGEIRIKVFAVRIQVMILFCGDLFSINPFYRLQREPCLIAGSLAHTPSDPALLADPK